MVSELGEDRINCVCGRVSRTCVLYGLFFTFPFTVFFCEVIIQESPPEIQTEQGLGRTGGYLQMNRLSLRNNRLKFKISGELPIIVEETI